MGRSKQIDTPIHKREAYDKLCEAIHLLVPCYERDIAQELELHSLVPVSYGPLDAEILIPKVARFIYDNEKEEGSTHSATA